MQPDPGPTIDWDKSGGLVPAVVQDAASRAVLMLGYMSRESLQATLRSGRVTFFSRSRGALWEKGQTSGNVLELVSLHADCDRDALLVLANPRGPTCHRGTTSCFDGVPPGDARGAGSEIARLDTLVAQRALDRPPDSYTTRLFDAGVRRIAQKVGEEGVETALAAVVQDEAALLDEASDLVYHLLVLLRARGLGLADLERTLAARKG